jgi:hypothetical protein
MGIESKLGFWCACISALAATGCAGDDALVPGLVEYVDQGDLCLFAEEPTGPISGAQEFADGSTLVVTVALPECLSMSCDVNRVASCEVVQDADRLVVTSYLSYEAAPEITQCTMDCGHLVATCESAPLPAGSYTVVLGGASHALDVPSTIESPCM